MVDVVRARGGLLFYFTRLYCVCLHPTSLHLYSSSLASRVCHCHCLSRLCGLRCAGGPGERQVGPRRTRPPGGREAGGGSLLLRPCSAQALARLETRDS